MLLTTPYGTLKINEEDGMGQAVWPRWQPVPNSSSVGWQSRLTRSEVPAADGSILGKGFASGVEAVLALERWDTQEQPTCGADLTTAMDTLRGHLYALLKDTQGASRLTWTPTGKNTRMIDDIQLGPIDNPKIIDNVRAQQGFTLDSPFPYSMDENQTLDVINNTTGAIVMTGTAWFMPVIKVYGPFTGGDFVITHNGLGVSISYDNARPGAPTIAGGEYLEIDTFRNVATKFAAGPVLSDAMAGIVLESSDFFPLVPGSNSITTNADARFLVNQAYM
jgi:hypothetical protein